MPSPPGYDLLTEGYAYDRWAAALERLAREHGLRRPTASSTSRAGPGRASCPSWNAATRSRLATSRRRWWRSPRARPAGAPAARSPTWPRCPCSAASTSSPASATRSTTCPASTRSPRRCAASGRTSRPAASRSWTSTRSPPTAWCPTPSPRTPTGSWSGTAARPRSTSRAERRCSRSTSSSASATSGAAAPPASRTATTRSPTSSTCSRTPGWRPPPCAARPPAPCSSPTRARPPTRRRSSSPAGPRTPGGATMPFRP